MYDLGSVDEHGYAQKSRSNNCRRKSCGRDDNDTRTRRSKETYESHKRLGLLREEDNGAHEAARYHNSAVTEHVNANGWRKSSNSGA